MSEFSFTPVFQIIALTGQSRDQQHDPWSARMGNDDMSDHMSRLLKQI